jgi:hypothetical protein
VRRLYWIPALALAGSLHAGTITVATGGESLRIKFGSTTYSAGNTLSYSPAGERSTDPNWSYTAALLTNLVDAGGGVWTANGSLQIQFTNVSLTCIASEGCDQTVTPLDFGFSFRLNFVDASAINSYALSLSGSGPDLQLVGGPLGSSTLNVPSLNLPISAPTYSFSQSGALAPATNMAYGMTFELNGNYAVGTSLSLPGSFDIAVNTVPEPASFALLATGIGLAAWRLRRRRPGRSRE